MLLCYTQSSCVMFVVVVVVVCRLYHEESGREIKLLLSQESITTAEKMCREIQVSLSLSFERYQFWILCCIFTLHTNTLTHTHSHPKPFSIERYVMYIHVPVDFSPGVYFTL